MPKLYRKPVFFGDYVLAEDVIINDPKGLPVFVVFPNPADGQLLQVHLGYIQFSHRTKSDDIFLKFDIANPNLGENFREAVIKHIDNFDLHFAADKQTFQTTPDGATITQITFTGFILHEQSKS